MRRLAALLLLLLWPLSEAPAQDAPAAAPGDFVARARAGTARLRDPEVARAAGYRPVGPDFPSMGRHWIHPGLILRDEPAAAEPALLEYAEITGHLTLVGVAYAALVQDARPPRGLPVPPEAWHYHQGTVEEESFLRSHAGVAHVKPGPRIAVLHAWIWLINPDGLFATDNWALPFARLGYRAPAAAPRDAARAIALAAGDDGRAYLQALLRAVGRPSLDQARAIDSTVLHHEAAVRALLSRAPALDPPLAHLARCWSELWDDLRGTLPPDVWERLQPIR